VADTEGIYFDLARLCRILIDFNPVEASANPFAAKGSMNESLDKNNIKIESEEELKGLKAW
jgi:hypothetical protein